MPSNSSEIDTRYAQKISVVNNGGFVMEFKVARRQGGQEGDVTDYSSNLALGSEYTFNLEDFADHLAVGDEIFPIVHAWLGSTVPGPGVQYAPNGQVATYVVSGTTLGVNVKLL